MSGRLARALVNGFARALCDRERAILPYPLQNAVPRATRAAAAARGDTQSLALWAGQAAELARDLPAADLVAALVREAERCLGKLATTARDASRGMMAQPGRLGHVVLRRVVTAHPSL